MVVEVYYTPVNAAREAAWFRTSLCQKEIEWGEAHEIISKQVIPKVLGRVAHIKALAITDESKYSFAVPKDEIGTAIDLAVDYLLTIEVDPLTQTKLEKFIDWLADREEDYRKQMEFAEFLTSEELPYDGIKRHDIPENIGAINAFREVRFAFKKLMANSERPVLERWNRPREQENKEVTLEKENSV